VILVVGLLVIPASTAYLLCDRLSRMLVVSACFGVSSFYLGYAFSEAINVAPGSAIVLAGCAQFVTVLVIAPRYGLIADWLRRRRMVPQQLVEDVLGVLLREPQQRASLNALMKQIPGDVSRFRQALTSLDRQGMLTLTGDFVVLTPEGEKEGRRLVRAHRLWEAYLEHVGAPAAELHARAHRLEHVNDEDAVDYIDDKLGHPLTDPHGAEIPQDVVHVVPGAVIGAAQLREGRQGMVTSVGPSAAVKGFAPGMHITAGPRLAQGKIWTFVLPSGQSVELDHVTTDALEVRLDDVPEG
jgi:manganese/iron transport system permease protein/iron/zinc/copper transport system permease protein